MSKKANLAKALSLLSAASIVMPMTAYALPAMSNDRIIAMPTEAAGVEHAAYLGRGVCRHLWRGHWIGCCPPLLRSEAGRPLGSNRCVLPHHHFAHPAHEHVGRIEHPRAPHEHGGGGHRPFPRPEHHHHHHGHGGEGGDMGGRGMGGGDTGRNGHAYGGRRMDGAAIGLGRASEGEPGTRLGAGHGRYGGVSGPAMGGFPAGATHIGRPAMSAAPVSGRMPQPAMGAGPMEAPHMGAPHMGGGAIGAAPSPAIGGMQTGGMHTGGMAVPSAAPMATPAAAPQMATPHMAAPPPAPAPVAAPAPAPAATSAPAPAAPAVSAGHR